MAASNHADYSSFTSPFSTPSWDVFLSFRGEDTRKTFTDHLYRVLVDADVRTFKDDPGIKTGEEISSELLNAIQDSYMSVIVFSENYAESKWCLDELEEILKCRRTKEHYGVVPVFYDVSPAIVRRQTESFAKAFQAHERRYEKGKVKRWRDALTTAAGLSGCDLSHHANGYESYLVQIILKKVQAHILAAQLADQKFTVQLAARDLLIVHGENSSHWSWYFQENDRNAREVAELINVYWLHVEGIYKEQNLKQGWSYEVKLKVLLKNILEMDATVTLALNLPDGTKQERRENLMTMPRNKVIVLKVGEFRAQNMYGGDVKFSLRATNDNKCKTGLVIIGAEIAPKDFRPVQS